MQRVRDRSILLSSSGTATQYSSSGAVLPGYPVTTPISVVQRDVMVDENTPKFKLRSAKGEIFIKPMSKIVESCVFVPANTVMQTASLSAHYDGMYDVGGLNWSPESDPVVKDAVDSVKALAITEAYANVGSPDVAVLTELVELRETLSFLYSPVKAMVKLTNRFRSHLKRVTALEESYKSRLAKWEKLPLRLQSKREPPKKPKLPVFSTGRFKGSDVASAWLAYRYGLMPLIYTFQDVEKLLKKQLEGPPKRATARSKREFSKNVDETLSDSTFYWSGGTFRSVNKRVGHVKATARAGVLYEPDFSLNTQLGVQWNRVPAALYEGVTLSFVTDWFHNGADVYDALTAEFRAQEILGAWVTVEVDFGLIWSGETLAVSNCHVSDGELSFQRNGKWKTRQLASLSDVEFRLKNDLNSKRIADGLALIYTFLATARKK
jgi:hypothetical protein